MDPFDAPDLAWSPVSPRLAALRRTALLVVGGAGVGIAVALIAVLASGWYAAAAALLGAAVVVWGWWAVGRNVASWGYTERAEDLLIRRGVLFRQLVVVPYGRMQFVDVHAGPLDRAYKLAAVQLHTASASTDARIPGLVPAEAARLRDRLAELGQAQSAGL